MTMIQNLSKQRNILRLTCIMFVTIGLVSTLPLNVAGQDTLTFTINRNIGTRFGNLISGVFTLHGSGPTTIQNLTVYFNGEQVHFAEGNTISWQFNTGGYPGGTTNVTLVGIPDTGSPYVATKTVFFIDTVTTNIMTIGIIALVAVLLIAKYGSKLRKS